LASGQAQLVLELDVVRSIGCTPAITVHVALAPALAGAGSAPHRLTASGLAAAMFAPLHRHRRLVRCAWRAPTAVPRPAPPTARRNKPRVARVLDALATVSNDIALVAFRGAGHAARVVAEAEPAVRDLLLLGTPLSAISLSALAIQPTADALRLLQRLLLPVDATEPDDPDLALGRALVDALMSWRRSPIPPPTCARRSRRRTRAGLTVTALFGEVADVQIARAMTAIVASGLAGARTPEPMPPGGLPVWRPGCAGYCPTTPPARSPSRAAQRSPCSDSTTPAVRATSACCGSSSESPTGSAGSPRHPISNCARSRPT
jgi:hypothetical protein